ncbi:hypothetical protein [Lactococcus formosensis]|nr:hypothetical protein [Lactococcus formosensis]
MKKIISLGLILLGILADQLLKGWTVANIGSVAKFSKKSILV